MAKLITLKNVRKEFGKKLSKVIAVKDVNFSINEGENLALVGTNGAGKTTTIEMIMGINKPTSGQIIYDFSKTKNIDIIKKSLGIQFQDSIYPQYVSVKEIVNFIIHAYNIKISPSELKHMLRVFKIDVFIHCQAVSLSGGQSQRLNIFLSLLHKPKVVFLDELSTGLDITTRNEFKKFIYDYTRKHGMTVVLISHNIDEIVKLCDRLILLKNGVISEDMSIEKYKKNPKELEKFLERKLH